MPIDCLASKLRCPIVPVDERNIVLVQAGLFPYHPMFWHLFSSIPIWAYITVIVVVWLSQLPKYEGVTTLYSARRLSFINIAAPHRPGLWEGYCVVTARGMSIPSNVLVFILPHTCMIIYYCDNSGLVEPVAWLWGCNYFIKCAHRSSYIDITVPHRPSLWEGYWVVTTRGMPVSFNVLPFILPHTCKSLYYCDNDGLIERLPGYESVTTL